jgi:hypothetical protein
MKIGYPDTKNKPDSPLLNRKIEKSARKAAKAYKKFAEADAEPTTFEKSKDGYTSNFKKTKKAKRKEKAGKRKLDKSRAITKDMSAEDRKKAVKSFSKRMGYQN